MIRLIQLVLVAMTCRMPQIRDNDDGKVVVAWTANDTIDTIGASCNDLSHATD